MAGKKSWGSTVAGWFVVQEPSSDAESNPSETSGAADDAAIKRLLEPAEVAQAVTYLCSPAASFVTGSNIVLDGGWSAR